MKLFSENTPLDHDKLIDFTLNASNNYRFLSVTSFGQDSAGRIMPAFSIGEGDKSIIYIGTCETASFLLLRFVDEFCQSCTLRRRVASSDPLHIYSSRRITVIPAVSLYFGEDKEKALQNMKLFTSKCDNISSVTQFCSDVGRVGYYSLPEFAESSMHRTRRLSHLSGYDIRLRKGADGSLEESISSLFRSSCTVGCGCEYGQIWIDKYLSLRRLLFENLLFD